jgi:transcriptional regulator with XRE-family HTH domain
MSRKKPVHPIIAELCEIRRRKRISQATLAEMIGTSQSGVFEHEHGIRSPALNTLARWADALGYRITLTLKEDPPEYALCTAGEHTPECSCPTPDQLRIAITHLFP